MALLLIQEKIAVESANAVLRVDVEGKCSISSGSSSSECIRYSGHTIYSINTYGDRYVQFAGIR